MGEVSTREGQVLLLAANGKTDEGIATELGITVATVRGYWLRIRTKLGGSGRAELVAQWIRAANDANDSLLEQHHTDQMRESLEDSDQAVLGERAAMDELLKDASPEIREAIQRIRDTADEGRRSQRQRRVEGEDIKRT